jgi:hypothetical protein
MDLRSTKDSDSAENHEVQALDPRANDERRAEASDLACAVTALVGARVRRNATTEQRH